MGIFQILFLAIALSIDAMTVSFTQGLMFKTNKRKTSFLLALFFGFFQFLMPVIGYFCSLTVYNYLKIVNTWIIFIIFMFLGVKFIKDAFEEKQEKICCLTFMCLLTFAIATSIDALGAGISLCFAKANIWFASIIIGIITFINSLIGFWGGFLFQKLPAKYLQIFGGLILIGLAIKAIL
ncbi:MAG: manganese efflux pump [Candidatus Gastranaerophilales bacterium]|nr:manganese efflux pump [Candidatus Gastranaerophilales bacterium]